MFREFEYTEDGYIIANGCYIGLQGDEWDWYGNIDLARENLKPIINIHVYEKYKRVYRICSKQIGGFDMYQLNYDKNKFEIVISPMKVRGTKVTKGNIAMHNEHIYISDDRKLLLEFAKELKQKWINEFEEKLNLAKEMKIKNKYK